MPLLAFAQDKTLSSLELQPMVVTGKRSGTVEEETQDVIRTYDSTEMENSGSFSAEEFIATLPRGSGEQQLVLVDGVPTYLDLAALSPEMIAAIEVSYTGAMPAYGAYARGRIINIKLKQNYDGRELSLEGAGSVHGDAWRREAMISGGSFHGPWKAMYSARYSRQDAVTADERDFSREQDHRAAGGQDFRVPWGYPAVVQAAAGNLNGVVDAQGNPVAVALVPDGATGLLAPGDFLAGTGPAASGQRAFTTSPYLYLAAPSESLTGNFRLTRAFGPQLVVSFNASYRASQSERAGPPPVSAAAAGTLVPAALNPFGQDVLVGLVHTGFGPVIQQSENDQTRLNLSAVWTGKVWRSNATLNHSRSHSERDTRDLDPDAFAAALAATDPAARFNPFAGAAGSPANTALYPGLAIHRLENAANNGTQLNLRTSGAVGAGWGAGPVRLTLGANANWRDDARTFRNLRGVADASTWVSDSNWSSDANVEAPLVKGRAGLHRLDGRLNAAYSANEAGGSTQRLGMGVLWAPVRPWLFRASYGERRSAPGEQADDDITSAIETLVDPQRTPAAAENVQVVSRRTASSQSSKGEDVQFTITFEPASRPGLRFTTGFVGNRQQQATGNPFNPQDVIDNETLFAGRVVRDNPTAADIALGQPGRILAVDTSAAAVAGQERSELDFDVEYQLPERPAGRFNFSAGVEYLLYSRYELVDGQDFVSREDGPANQPDWTGRARLQWQGREWTAQVQVRHASDSRQGTIPAFTGVNANVGYRFARPLWRKFGKGLQLRAAVQNLGGDRPPYADTVLGYRGGSAVGTVFSLSARLPL